VGSAFARGHRERALLAASGAQLELKRLHAPIYFIRVATYKLYYSWF